MQTNENRTKYNEKLRSYYESFKNEVVLSRSQKSRVKIVFVLCLFIYLCSIIDTESPYQTGLIVDRFETNYGIDCDSYNEALKKDDVDSIKTRFHDVIDKAEIPLHDGTKWPIQYRPLLNCMEADNPWVSFVLKNQLMIPPSPWSVPYDVASYNDKFFEMKNSPQANDVMEMVYKNKLKHGFFVEAGAGECQFSVSLALEYNFRWTGVLVEAVPQLFRMCKKVNRKSWLLNACLAASEKSSFSNFNTLSTGGMKSETTKKDITFMGGFANKEQPYVKLQCFPIEAIVAAVDNPVVNLFVLDIEGYELAVLRSIPWDKVNIEVLSVETDLAGLVMKDSSREKIIKFMESKGYTRFDHRDDFNPNTGRNQNDMFVRNDIVKKNNVVQL